MQGFVRTPFATVRCASPGGNAKRCAMSRFACRPRYDTKARRYLEFTDDGPVAKENFRGAFCQLWSEFLKRKLETGP